jgi:hypothetical protein
VPGVRIVPEGRIVIAGQAYQDAAMYARDHTPGDSIARDVRIRSTFAHDLAIWQREA